MIAVALICVLTGFADSAEMKLMSFNVCHCEGMDGRIDIARTAARIRAENPDFACLQEIDWRTARVNGIDEPAELARLTGLHATFAKAVFYAGGQYGVMMLSRQKPVSVRQIPLPGTEPRVLLLCEFADCWVGTTHLSVSGEQERIDSIAIIRRAVAEAGRTKPIFLTGDWNSTPESKVLKGIGEFMSVFSDTACQTFHGRQMDSPDGRPLDMSRFCIDYIAVDSVHASEFRVTNTHVVEDRVTSDHAPIVATVAVPVPELPAPVVVPRPTSLKGGKGVRFEKATEVTAELIRFTDDPSVAKEGYDLRIDPEGIAVSASTETGRFYALETLKQLALPRLGKLAFPCLEIKDAPRFGWRGVHIDDSRHFFGKTAVKRTLDLMAFHKLNVLHWHLTDDEGWRFPVSSHPELASEAAKRPYSSNQKDLADKFEDGTYGPFAYSEADIREVVAYAAERHIRVVPEIDFPGHSRGALRAHPELLCFRPGDPKAPQGAVDNVFCLGNDETLKLFDDVFEAVCDIFPDKFVHIGGDEVNKVNWEACPKCRARMEELGLKDGKALQSWQMNRTAAMLSKRGKRVIGWDEMILDGQAPERSVVMSWRGREGGIAAAKLGLESVMTPHTSCYLDYDQCVRDDPAVYPWFTERLPLEKVYAYDPFEGVPAEQRKFILGGQCCNWAEYTCDETELQWKMWPRACATAEVFWTPAAKRDFADFRRRMETHRRRLIGRHVNCAPLE